MKKTNARPSKAKSSAITHAQFTGGESQPPIVTGQCAEVLSHLKAKPSVISFELTAGAQIPEAAARIHDLRAKGFNILTTIEPEIVYCGKVRRNVARYSLASPTWPAPGFLRDELEGGK
jgi:hypothetical protein